LFAIFGGLGDVSTFKRRVFLVETRMRFDQFSAVALPFKVEPRDARGTRLVD
jgi:hypothetical protein